MFYTLMLRHLFKQHGYVPGRDFYVIPFDWRIGVQGLEQVGGWKALTRTLASTKAAGYAHTYVLV